MAYSIIEMTSIDDQISLIPQTQKDEIEEGDHVIDIKDTNGQVPSGSQIKKSLNQIYAEKFTNLDNSSIKLYTIFKVNVWLRESNPAAYTPKMVSIGPYHNKNPQLHPMEKYKLLYLERFLQRKQGLDIESCINELEKWKEEAIKCYDDVEELDEFCQMLLLDGCFVVEFIREHCEIYPEEEDIIKDNNIGYIFRDLMLLENQLPFFVLDKLYDMTKQDDELPLAILLSKLILLPSFVKLPEMPLKSFIEAGGCLGIKHLLHFIHRRSCHENPKKKSENNEYPMWHRFIMPTATELSKAGVNFEKVNVTTSLFDSIEFEDGLMTVPDFRVEDATESLLRNLIAYEQQSIEIRSKCFSDFAFFMDRLIESDKDVNLLREKGIIENWIGEDQEVAKLFNKIGKGVNIDDSFYYKKECIKAREHCEKPWNKMQASLIRNYFSSPWVGASTVAAVILLILTTIQTILAFTDFI